MHRHIDLSTKLQNKSTHLDWGQANAGETRHFLDWMYGINLSRALTASIKATGAFKLLSIGRVQGPALKTIVEKEKEILAFKSKPFWQIELNGKIKEGELEAWHIEDKFWEKKKAEEIIKKIPSKKTGKIVNIYNAIKFLIESDYVNGSSIKIDGGYL